MPTPTVAASVFAPPLLPAQLSRSQARRRKRKRSEQDGIDGDSNGDDQDRNDDSSNNEKDDDDDHGERGRSSRESSSDRSSRPFASLPASQAVQYLVAGLSPDEEPPPAPFPHAPAPALRRSADASHASNPAATQAQGGSLKRRQLGVLTAILHRCMLQGDYERATRAWAMILRGEVNGHAVDPRAQGRWGIGAEILLRQSGKQNVAPTAPPLSEDMSTAGPDFSAPEPVYTAEGFKAAREYYDRLILQFPYHRHTPHSVNAMTFYPALFSVWISEVVDDSRRAREELQQELDRPDLQHDYDGLSSDTESSTQAEQIRKLARTAEIRAAELLRAQQIADRLDQLLLTPPTDKNVDLLHLRAMVALWIGDLHIKDAPAPGSMASSGESNVEDMTEFNQRREARRGQEIRKTEIEKARVFLQRVEENGGKVWGGATSVLNEARPAPIATSLADPEHENETEEDENEPESDSQDHEEERNENGKEEKDTPYYSNDDDASDGDDAHSNASSR